MIQQKVEDPLSDALLSGEFNDGEVIWVDLNEDKEIKLKAEEREPSQPEPA